MAAGLERQEGRISLSRSVPYLLLAPSRAKAPPLVICLHRYGGNPEQFSRIVTRLGLGACAFGFPRGPFRVVAGKGEIGFAWSVSTPREQDPEGRDFSLALVARLARTLARKLGTPAGKVYLLGHSQGGYLALHSLLREARLFAGAVSLGGHMNPDLARRTGAPSSSSRRAPRRALLLHGDADHLIPIQEAQIAKDLLTSAGVKASLTAYPGVGHWPTRQMYADAGEWIKSGVAPQRRKDAEDDVFS